MDTEAHGKGLDELISDDGGRVTLDTEEANLNNRIRPQLHTHQLLTGASFGDLGRTSSVAALSPLNGR